MCLDVDSSCKIPPDASDRDPNVPEPPDGRAVRVRRVPFGRAGGLAVVSLASLRSVFLAIVQILLHQE
jgi:hypothetical protein